jgi:hypothetical protein
MSQEERFGTRDRAYSAWHRRNSTRRFVGIENAQLLAMIDLDASLYVEYDDGSREPLALIETARDVGQPYKNAQVTLNLARRANIPCYIVLYKLSSKINPADTDWPDIESFRIMRLHPNPTPAGKWFLVSPEKWAEHLLELRKRETTKLDIEFTEVLPIDTVT